MKCWRKCPACPSLCRPIREQLCAGLAAHAQVVPTWHLQPLPHPWTVLLVPLLRLEDRNLWVTDRKHHRRCHWEKMELVLFHGAGSSLARVCNFFFRFSAFVFNVWMFLLFLWSYDTYQLSFTLTHILSLLLFHFKERFCKSVINICCILQNSWLL